MPKGPGLPKLADKPRALKSRARTILGEFLARISIEHEKQRGKAWPAVKWQSDPVGFVYQILGIRLIRWQRRALKAIARRRNARVAVSSGQKIGKTMLLACLMIWYWACFPEAKVTMTATTETQVDNVVWDEVKRVVRFARDKRGIDLLAGGCTLAENPRTGLEAPDGRSIRGLTVRQIEAMGGISGENMLFVADEASSLSEALAQAMTGNTAAGARMIWTSNPTKTEGPFYDIFHNPQLMKDWRLYSISSEDIAKELHDNRRKVKGMASLFQIRRWAERYGRDSAFFRVRVLGQFLTTETGKVISLHVINEAQKRWSQDPDPIDMSEPLSIGIDVAGAGQDGDPWAFSFVRGHRVIDYLYLERGLTIEAAAGRLRFFLKKYRLPNGEVPRVVVDAEGDIGGKFLKLLQKLRDALDIKAASESFEVYGVRGSQPATREPQIYDRTREELWANLARWLAEGGAIPARDYELATELHAPEWIKIEGKAKVTPKEGVAVKTLRKILGRSPDRADSLALATWPKSHWGQPDAEEGNLAQVPGERGGVEGANPFGEGVSQEDAGSPWWPQG